MSNSYPGAVQKRIKAGSNDPQITPVMALLHVAVSWAYSLFGWFNGPSGGIESHFYIRRSGVVEQYRSVGREADANYGANSYDSPTGRLGAVSIETAGLGGGRWNAKQLEAIKALLLWLHDEHGIPFRVVTTAQPKSLERGGVGYHSQFLAWSNVRGKTCPGPARIRQFEDVIVPWLRLQNQPCLHCPHHCP